MGLDVRLEIGDHPSIHVSGETIHQMKRKELDKLLFGKYDLIEKIQALHGGHKIDDFHLSDEDQVPGNLEGSFSKYRWKPVQVLSRAKDAQILEVTNQPAIVGRAPVSNESSIPHFEAHYEITENVSDSIAREAHWDVSSTIEQTVSYEVGGDAVGGKVGGSTSVSFTGGYGQSDTKEKTVDTGSLGSGTVPLEPGQKAVVELSASRGSIKARVDYEQQIRGGVFYHFGKRVDGHYLWYASMSKLYSHSELVKVLTEDLHIRVYSEMAIRLVDA